MLKVFRLSTTTTHKLLKPLTLTSTRTYLMQSRTPPTGAPNPKRKRFTNNKKPSSIPIAPSFSSTVTPSITPTTRPSTPTGESSRGFTNSRFNDFVTSGLISQVRHDVYLIIYHYISTASLRKESLADMFGFEW